ncbi:MAG: DUF3500 domain-containing protein [Pseudomonadota bacterium]
MIRYLFLVVACTVCLGLTSTGRAHDDTGLFEVDRGATVAPRVRMTQVAKELLASVSGKPSLSEVMDGYSKRDMLLHPVDDSEVEKWTFWPTERVGLPLKLMNVEQMTLTQELLWSLLSEEGYLKILNIMQLENLLYWTETQAWPRGMGDYVVVFFGDPSDAEWSWRFEGHHISLNVAVAPGGVSVTPSFLGAKPALVETGPLSGVRLLRTWEDGAKTLINTLSDEQRARATIRADADENALADSMGLSNFDGAPYDIESSHMLRPVEQWTSWRDLPTGIPAAALSDAQQRILMRLIDSVVGIYRPDFLADYELDTDTLTFAFSGTPASDGLLYFRIEDGRFFYEYLNTQHSYDHVHTVWRDKTNDFGVDIMKRHLELHHGSDGDAR